MYEWHLKFTVLLSRNDAVKLIQNCPSRRDFTHTVSTGIPADGDLQHTDIFIVDRDAAGRIESISAGKKPRARIIYAAAENETVPDEIYGMVQSVWRLDKSLREFKMRLDELLERYELERRDRLHFIWLETVIDASPDMMWIKDLDGAHLEVNETFCRMVSKTKEQIRGRGHYYIWDIEPEEYAKGEYVCVESDLEVINQRRLAILWENVKIKNEMRKFRTWKAPMFDDDGNVMGTIGIAKDVTDVLNLTNELETILNSMPFAVLLTDSSNCIRSVNSRFLYMFDCERDSLIGKSYSEVESLIQREGWYYTDEFHREMSYTSENGSKWLGLSDRDVQDVFGKDVGHILILEDITEEKEHAMKLLTEAHTDTLTGLFNRRYFSEQIPYMRIPGKPESIVFIDLDKFKHLNDTYGHDEGDRALITLASIMRSEFKTCHALMARLGGDEFLIYLCNMTREETEKTTGHFARTVRSEFAKSRTMNGLTCSVGVVFNNDTSAEIDDIVKAADAAMYKAKQSGCGVHILDYTPPA